MASQLVNGPLMIDIASDEGGGERENLQVADHLVNVVPWALTGRREPAWHGPVTAQLAARHHGTTR